MAFKRPVTTYFTNENQFELFDKRAKSVKKSHSKLIMGLIEKELQTTEQHTPDVSPSGCMALFPFIHHEPVSSSINSGFACLMESRVKSEIKKKIFETVDLRIKDMFIDHLNLKYGPHNKKRFIIVKLSLNIDYRISQNEHNETIVEGGFSYHGVFFELTELLWEKYNGMYDLTKIKYYKYLNLFKPQKQTKTVALLLEKNNSPDNAGGFFIPVHQVKLKYPVTLDGKKFEFRTVNDHVFNDGSCGVYLQLTGVNMYSNTSRVKFTQHEHTGKSISMNTSTRINNLEPSLHKSAKKESSILRPTKMVDEN
jgi:hypothetical protein